MSNSISPYNIEFDPKSASTAQLKPFETEDSVWSIVEQQLRIERGSRDRLIAYFRIDPMLASRAGNQQTLSIEYLDLGTGSFFIETVDSVSTSGQINWRSLDRISLTDSNTKQTASFNIEDADYTGAANGADFRVTIVDTQIDHFDVCLLNMHISKPATSFSKGRFLAPSTNTYLRFAPPATPLASIIIPVFNQLHYTLDCLRALAEFTPNEFELIVVNDGSSDQTQFELSKIEGLTLINNNQNLGFASACNLGAAKASAPYLVFLNNDTVPQPGWLGALVQCAKHCDMPGIVGSRLIYPHNGLIQSAGVGLGKYLLPIEEHRGSNCDDPALLVNRIAMAVSGASMLIERDLFNQLNGFDTGFLNGFEDIDLCLRARELGCQNWLCAHSDVLHYQSASEGRYDLEKDRSNITLFRERWHAKLASHESGLEDQRVSISDLPLTIPAAEDDIRHQTGHKSSKAITCQAGVHSPGHCAFGPYLQLANEGDLAVTFNVHFSGIQSDSAQLITLDVYDSVADQVLNETTLHPDDDSLAQPRLTFKGTPSQILEFRVYWHGLCDLELMGLTIDTPPEKLPPSVIRTVTQQDRSAVQSLFREIFKHSMSDALWDWKYAQGRGVAMLAHHFGKPVAHYGGIFRSVRYHGDQIQTLQCADIMVRQQGRSSLARKGTYHSLAVAFFDRHAGYDRTVLMVFGFPNKRLSKLGKLLGIHKPVGRVLEPRWSVSSTPSAALVEPELVDYLLPEDNYSSDSSKHQKIVNELDRCLANDLDQYIVGVRDSNYVAHRYLDNPIFNYEIKLVFDEPHQHCIGVIVFRQEGDSLLLMDLIAGVDNFAILIQQARRYAQNLKLKNVTMWVTQNHLPLLGIEPTSIHDPEVDIPTSTCTDGPSVETLSNKWFLTTGDTDFK